MQNLTMNKNSAYKIPGELSVASSSRFNAVCEHWLGEIIPGAKFQVKSIPSLYISSIEFFDRGEGFLPAATGFGITYALPIVVQALVASMIEKSIIIVENPEAHLHPYSQSAMGAFLALVASQGVQIIIETHSEHIINGCRLKLAKSKKTNLMSVMFFNKTGGGSDPQKLEVTEQGELSSWPEGFFDQSRRDLRELLEIRRNV
jgi:predicted ATPase